MTPNELRAAAEQFLDGGNRKGTDEFDTAVKNAQLLVECGDKMAHHILETVKADDGDEIAGWLHSCDWVQGLKLHLRWVTDTQMAFIATVNGGEYWLTTRGQFRALCKALNVEFDK